MAITVSGGALVRGDTEKIKLTIKNGDNSVRNITNDSIRFSLKRSKFDAVALLTKSVGSGIIKTNTAQGLAEVTINPADLLSLNREALLHADVEVTDSGGVVSTTTFTVPFELDVSQ